MKALLVKDIKKFMNILLLGDDFDDFYVSEVVVKKEYSMHIDGRKSVSDGKETPRVSYKDLKPLVYEHLKGKELPELFRLVLCRDKAQMEGVSSEFAGSAVSDYILRAEYTKDGLIIVTGVSYESFTMDKDGEKAWDEYVRRFITNLGADFDE